MKTRPPGHFIALILLLIVSGFSCKKSHNSTPAPISNVHLGAGLLLYFPFSGNIADSSGNNNSVLATGGSSLTSDEHGNVNSAYDASQGRLLVTNNGSVSFDTAFTVCFNFKMNNTGYQGYLSMVNNTSGFGPTFLLGTNLLGNPNFSFTAQNQGALCTAYGNPDFSDSDTTQFVPQAGTWYNMVCVYHKGNNQVYMNGNLISTHTLPGTGALLCPVSKFIIGGWWDGDPLVMKGTIDEVRLYNRVLNSDEINQLYKNFQ